MLARSTAPKNAPPPAVTRRVAAGFLACAAPDLDFVLSYAGPVVYLEQHRGVTHSLLLLPLWALLLSWLLSRILREPAGWRAFYGVVAMALGAHIAGDLITSFGTVVFAPLSDWRAAVGTTFIIDLWFTGIIVVGLLLSATFRSTRLPSIAAGVLLVGYVGLQFLQQQRALDFGAAYAAAQGIPNAVVSAHPRPVSPFNWTVFVSDETAHRFAHVNLVRREPRRVQPGEGFLTRMDAPYRPRAQAIWLTQTRYGHPPVDAMARQAWNSPALGFFRWFADLPAFDGLSEGSTCVWFIDLRFLTPGREGMPFRFGACRDAPDRPWQAYQRLDANGRRLLH